MTTQNICPLHSAMLAQSIAGLPSGNSGYFKGKNGKTLKSYALDYIQIAGELTSTEIRRYMYELSNPGRTYDSVNDRGWYSSYFSHSHKYCKNTKNKYAYLPGNFYMPSVNDDRVISKNANNTYSVVEYDSVHQAENNSMSKGLPYAIDLEKCMHRYKY